MLKSIFIDNTDSLIVQFFRYGIVATMAFFVDFGFLYFFTQYWHINYLVSATLSFLISLVLNYFLSIKWAFSKQSNYSYTTELLLFLIIGIVGLLFNDLIIWFSTEKLGVFYLISKLIATVIVFFWSFIARRYLFFQTTSTSLNVPLKG